MPGLAGDRRPAARARVSGGTRKVGERRHQLCQLDLARRHVSVGPDLVSDDMYSDGGLFAVACGHRMHFAHEGEGEPIVFVQEFRHGACCIRPAIGHPGGDASPEMIWMDTMPYMHGR